MSGGWGWGDGGVEGTGERPATRGARKVFSKRDGDGRVSPGGWPGWMEQEAEKSGEKRKGARRVRDTAPAHVT